MSYIGNTQQNQSYVPAVDFFSGDGSTTAFTLSKPVATTAQIQAVISNVPQTPGVAYTVSGSTITFTSAPPSGTNNIYVYYTSPNTQVMQPGQGTVGPTQVATDYALWNKSGSDVNYTAGNVGIGTSNPATKLQVSHTQAGATITSTSAGQPPYAHFQNTADSSNSYIYCPNKQLGLVQADASASSYIYLSTQNTERMRIDSSGNVGIGTSSPQQKLQVYSSAASGGQIQVTNSSTGAASTDGVLFGYDGSNDVIINNQEATATKFYTSGSERMRIDSSGNLLFNSGYGSAAVAYGCRAWVNFNGTGTVAIRASGNVSSIADNGNGQYFVNFTTYLPDSNFACIGSTVRSATWVDGGVTVGDYRGTNGFSIANIENQAGQDSGTVCAAAFR